MQKGLQQIVRNAIETTGDDFVEVVEQATHRLRTEDGKIGRFHILGRHVRIEPSGETVILSDIHGDLESLVEVLQQSRIVQRMEEYDDTSLIFLGDYGDRGQFSAEVYYTVLRLKLQYPDQIVLMRGNHEGPNDILAYPHDLPVQFQARFGKKWKTAYGKIVALFPHLYSSASVQKRCLIVHGGLPQNARKIDDFAYADKSHPEQPFLEDILWSDPLESFQGVQPSPRGAGRLFGKNVTDRVLKTLDVKMLIRGHEPCSEGFQVNHEGKILTIFSRKGEPYGNEHGAYLDINLSGEYDDARQLMPYVHKF